MKNIAIITAGLTIKTTYEIGNGINECAREHGANVFYFASQRRYDESVLHDISVTFELPEHVEGFLPVRIPVP